MQAHHGQGTGRTLVWTRSSHRTAAQSGKWPSTLSASRSLSNLYIWAGGIGTGSAKAECFGFFSQRFDYRFRWVFLDLSPMNCIVLFCDCLVFSKQKTVSQNKLLCLLIFVLLLLKLFIRDIENIYKSRENSIMNSEITLSLLCQHQLTADLVWSKCISFLTLSTTHIVNLILQKMFLMFVPEVHWSNSLYRPEIFMKCTLHLLILSYLSEKVGKSKLWLLIVMK